MATNFMHTERKITQAVLQPVIDGLTMGRLGMSQHEGKWDRWLKQMTLGWIPLPEKNTLLRKRSSLSSE